MDKYAHDLILMPPKAPGFRLETLPRINPGQMRSQ